MGDYMAASIRIGGTLKASLVSHFIDVVVDQGCQVGLEWDSSGGGTEPSDIHEAIDEAIKGKTYLTFSDVEAKSGMFFELEQWCRNNGLSYWRHNSPKYEFECMIEWFTPGMQREADCHSTEQESVLVNVEDILGWISDGRTADEIAAKLRADKMPPATPPLIVVDDTGQPATLPPYDPDAEPAEETDEVLALA